MGKFSTSKIAGTALEVVVRWIDDNIPVPRSMHPDEKKYRISPKNMARIIRHDGNLKASTSRDATNFYVHVLKWLANQREVPSLLSDYSFLCTLNNGSLEIQKKFNPRVLRGKKPCVNKNKKKSKRASKA